MPAFLQEARAIFFLYTSFVMKPTTFILFGATGDLAVKKIFPALEALVSQGAFAPDSEIVAVSRREWDDADFADFLLNENAAISAEFARSIKYFRVDIDQETGYEELGREIRQNENGVVAYLSLAPQNHPKAFASLVKAGIIARGKGRILVEKPFGTDEKSACELDSLILSEVNEDQVFRVDHYLAKDTVLALMDLHEATHDFGFLLSSDTVSSIRIALFESKGIEGRGASYDGVGAFRDVGQNHMLEMLAVLAAENAKGRWQEARADVLVHLAPPAKTCELSRRGQYEGYLAEKGVKPDSETETAFQVTTSLAAGKLKGVPLQLESGKKMNSSRAFIEIFFKEIENLPQKMTYSVSPEQEIVIEYGEGKRDAFKIPKREDAYANLIRAALLGSSREFAGREEIEALWRYADHVVACWGKVPLEIYSAEKPFLVQ